MQSFRKYIKNASNLFSKVFYFINQLWSKYESEVLLLAPWSPSWPNLRCPPTLSYEPTQFHSLGSLAPFHSIGGATRFISSAQLSPSKQGLWYYILIFFNQTISCCSILVSFGENMTPRWFCWFSQEKLSSLKPCGVQAKETQMRYQWKEDLWYFIWH